MTEYKIQDPSKDKMREAKTPEVYKPREDIPGIVRNSFGGSNRRINQKSQVRNDFLDTTSFWISSNIAMGATSDAYMEFSTLNTFPQSGNLKWVFTNWKTRAKIPLDWTYMIQWSLDADTSSSTGNDLLWVDILEWTPTSSPFGIFSAYYYAYANTMFIPFTVVRNFNKWDEVSIVGYNGQSVDSLFWWIVSIVKLS